MKPLLRRVVLVITNRTLQVLLLGICVAAVVLPMQGAVAARRPHSYPAMGKEAISSMFVRGDLAKAKLMLDDVWTVGREAPVHLSAPLTWREDPYNDPYWRFEFYGLRPLQDLLFAWYDTADTRYRDKLCSILESFLDTGVKSPYLTTDVDLHAAAWRTMVLVNTYVKLQESSDLPTDLGSRLLAQIEAGGAFLADPAHYQATFNHGFNESAALLLIAENFPSLADAVAWKQLALGRLDTLTTEVIDVDGVEVENSPYYEFYVLNTLGEIHQWAERSGIAVPDTIESAINRMTRFAADMVMPNGHSPLVGASLDLDVTHYKPAVLGPLAAANPTLAYALSGGKQGSPPERAVLFPASGLAILRSPLASGEPLANQTWVSLDAGPWRNLHNQLNRLSTVMYSAGQVVLVDAGLYQYAPAGSHGFYDNDYFYSTAAHNTVVIDGLNQSRDGQVGAGQTMASPAGWSYQSGWTTATAGVMHRRAVVVISQDTVLVVDELDGTGSHSYEQTWHLAPDLALSQVGLDTFGLDGSGKRVLAIRQGLADGLSLSSSAGGTLTSWYSGTYGQKVQNPVVAYGARSSHQTYATLITTGSLAAQDAHISASTIGGAISAQICAGGKATTVQIDGLAQAGEQVSVSGDGATCQPGVGPAVVSVTKPKLQTPATGMTTLAAEASGPLPISRIEFAVNGTLVGTATKAPFEVNWDSKTLMDGSLVAVTATAYDSAGGKVTSLAREVVVSNATTRASPTIVSLTFDDSLSNQYSVEPMLAAHGMHATFYVISGSIDMDGHLTLAQLRQLAADGDEIGGHTVDHVLLPTVPRNEQLRQVCDDRNRLIGLGFQVTTFAYPFSGYDPGVGDVVSECGYNGARMVGGMKAAAAPITPADPHHIPSVLSFTSDTTLAEMIADVTAAEQAGGGWVPLVFHNICLDTCRTNAVSPDTISALIDWLSARSGAGTTVETVAQVLGGPVQPPVSAPAPPAFGSASNMLANPGLETSDQLRPGMAECWISSASRLRVSGLATVDGTVTLTTDAHSGAVAARLNVTAVRDPSGADLRLVVPQDEGGCSPPAVGGHRYTVSAWYKSTVPVHLRVRYRDATGTWHQVGSSPASAAASQWTLATWTTPALPAGATNVSVRFTISEVGTATVDDFTLRDAGALAVP